MLQNNRIPHMILYIVKNLERGQEKVGRTRIIKLLFLADLLAKKKRRKSLTGTRYYYHIYGPYSVEIANAIDSLVRRRLLQDFPEPTEFGLAHNYKLTAKGRKSLSQSRLSDEEREILDRVIKLYGNLPLLDLLDSVYATEPMKKAVPGKALSL